MLFFGLWYEGKHYASPAIKLYANRGEYLMKWGFALPWQTQGDALHCHIYYFQGIKIKCIQASQALKGRQTASETTAVDRF